MAHEFFGSILKGGLPEYLDLGRSGTAENTQQNVERAPPAPASPPLKSASFGSPYVWAGVAVAVVVAAVVIGRR